MPLHEYDVFVHIQPLITEMCPFFRADFLQAESKFSNQKGGM